jgi:hypothetical protein
MTNRIRIFAVALLTALAVAVPQVAHAGPTRHQPATKIVTSADARQVAQIVLTDLVRAMPKPRYYRIEDCRGYGNRKLQQCSVLFGAPPDSRCTAALWVWYDGDFFYYEWHQMKCS